MADASRFDLLESILNSLADGVVVTDPQGRLALGNATAGWMRKACLDGVHGEVLDASGVTPVPASELPVNRALRGEAVENLEVLVRERDGLERWVLVTARPLTGAGGANLGAVAVCKDISARKRIELERAENERRYRAIFNSTFECVGLLSPDGTLLEANQTALDLIGANHSEVQGRKFWDTPWWQYSEVAAEQIRDAIARGAGGQTFRREADHIDREGVTRRFDFCVQPIHNEAGAVVSLLAEARDITLLEARKRYEVLLESAPDAILEVGPGGRIATANAMAVKMFGYEKSELIGQSADLLVPAGLRGGHGGKRESYMADPRTRPMGGGLELQAQRKDGSLVPVEISLSPVPQPGGMHVTAIIRDITERKQAADMVKASAEQFETLFRAGPAPEWVMDRESGRFLAVNDMAAEAFGYSRDEFLEMSVGDVRIEEAPNGISRFQRKDGSVIVAEPTGHNVVYRGRKASLVIAQDVTERERSAQLLRQAKRDAEMASKAKSDFLASMSHELRSPLHTIIGFAELLAEELEGPLNPKQKRFVQNIHQDSRHLLEIINDLLDISKIEAGRMEMRLENFPMLAAAEETLSSIGNHASLKGIAIANLLPAALLNADRLRFKQILYNLLSNAVKFTPEGGSISLTALGRRDRIAITVSDSGVGIASEDQEAIFEKFFQSGATTRGVREGTGLGLAITQQLVEQQGGRIWVDSQLGRGSRFTFTVRSSSSPEAKPLVVIAGAEPQSAELLVNYLEPKGYATALAANASRAAMLVSELRPAAIVLDLMGPAGESWNALRSLPDTPPIIVVSVVDEDELSRSLGAAAHLTKPVSKGLLTETLARHGARAGGKTVLVVDDEGAARELIVEILREAGYAPIAVANGEEALTALADSIPAAVVLDLLMPGMSGIELLTRVKGSPRLAAIPVIVLTGMEIGMEDAQLLRQAAKALLPKGSGWKEHLLKELRQVVSSSVR